MNNNYLTTEETAAVLEMSIFSIRLWLRQGKIEGRKISGTWLIPYSEIERVKKERAPVMSKPSFLKRIFHERKRSNINA